MIKLVFDQKLTEIVNLERKFRATKYDPETPNLIDIMATKPTFKMIEHN